MLNALFTRFCDNFVKRGFGLFHTYDSYFITGGIESMSITEVFGGMISYCTSAS